jgi:hypothetical protein
VLQTQLRPRLHVCCSALQTQLRPLLHVCCSVLQCAASTVAVYATHCNTLQHTATHCNTLLASWHTWHIVRPCQRASRAAAVTCISREIMRVVTRVCVCVCILCVCVCMGGCRCAAYGNLSLQHWPVETKCRPCEPGQQGPQCCFANHKIRNCNPRKYAGGAPGHCSEVPALALKEGIDPETGELRPNRPGAVPAADFWDGIGYVEFCQAEDENSTRRSMKLSDERSGGAQPSAVEGGNSDEVAPPTVELTQDEAQRVKAIESEHDKLRAQVREQRSHRHRQWVYGGLHPPTLLSHLSAASVRASSAASRSAQGDKSPGEDQGPALQAQGPALYPAHHPAPVR